MTVDYRKIFSLLVLSIALYSLSGCNGGGSTDSGSSTPPKVDEKGGSTTKPGKGGDPPPITPPPITPSSDKNEAGVFLNRNYEYTVRDSLTTNKSWRYVFHDSSVDIFEKLQSYTWIIQIDGKPHQIYAQVEGGNIRCSYEYGKIIPLEHTRVKSSGVEDDYLYKLSDFETIVVSKPEEWGKYLMDAKVPHWGIASKLIGAVVPLDQSVRQNGGNTESEVFNVESDGLILASATNQDRKLKLAD